jgi:hypothetical protein
MRRELILFLALGSSACSERTTPSSPSTFTMQAVQFSDLKAVVGTYTLTVELDDSCGYFPVAAQHRTYRADLEDRGWHYLLVGLRGGGYSEVTHLGELFSSELSLGRSSGPQLKWNTVDTGCDIAEPLGNSGSLAVCGQGPAVLSESGLDAAISGSAYLLRGGAVVAQCRGAHRFLFEHTR